MSASMFIYVVIVLLVLILLILALHVVKQYEMGVVFRLGRVIGVKNPGLVLIIPIIDRLAKLAI